MFSNVSANGDEMSQIKEWYAYYQQQIEEKFRDINTDALEEIRNKMRHRQSKIENEENIELIEKERSKIIEHMQDHVK